MLKATVATKTVDHATTAMFGTREPAAKFAKKFLARTVAQSQKFTREKFATVVMTEMFAAQLLLAITLKPLAAVETVFFAVTVLAMAISGGRETGATQFTTVVDVAEVVYSVAVAVRFALVRDAVVIAVKTAGADIASIGDAVVVAIFRAPPTWGVTSSRTYSGAFTARS